MKKKSQWLLIGITCTFLLSACSLFINENEQPIISASVDNDELVIRNGTGIDIYYFAATQSSLPYIFWVPTVNEENGINPGKIATIDIELFYTGDPEPIVVYYWDEDISEIFSILIE